MGDISAEPSMEEILSSIKRIIAEESEAQPPRIKRPVRPAATRPEPAFADDEILELSDPVEPAPDHAPAPVAADGPVADGAVAADALLSPRTAEAMRGPFDALSRMVVKPENAGSDTLEGLVREMLRPMLRDWLDARLPGMVETMVAREIDRITGK